MTEYTRTLMEVFEEVGTHLSNAVDEPGGFKGTSRSDITNQIVDIPTLKKPDSILKDLPAKDIAILVGIVAVAVGAAVGITVIVKDRKAKKLAEIEREAKRLKPTQLQAIEIENSDQFREFEVESYESTSAVELTSEQWNYAISEMLKLEAFREKAWDLLKNAIIVDDEQQSLDWKKKLEKATPEQLAQMIKAVLTEHPEILKSTDFSEMKKYLFNQGPEDGPAALGALTR